MASLVQLFRVPLVRRGHDEAGTSIKVLMLVALLELASNTKVVEFSTHNRGCLRNLRLLLSRVMSGSEALQCTGRRIGSIAQILRLRLRLLRKLLLVELEGHTTVVHLASHTTEGSHGTDGSHSAEAAKDGRARHGPMSRVLMTIRCRGR